MVAEAQPHAPLARSVVDEFEALCAEHRLTLTATYAQGIQPCIADPDRIRQVVRNIIANAVKFSLWLY